jgi:hypothetical protein
MHGISGSDHIDDWQFNPHLYFVPTSLSAVCPSFSASSSPSPPSVPTVSIAPTVPAVSTFDIPHLQHYHPSRPSFFQYNPISSIIIRLADAPPLPMWGRGRGRGQKPDAHKGCIRQKNLLSINIKITSFAGFFFLDFF